WIERDGWAYICERCKYGGLKLALAGSLRRQKIIRLLPLEPDLLAGRGAACAGGRQGTGSRERAAELGRLAAGCAGWTGVVRNERWCRFEARAGPRKSRSDEDELVAVWGGFRCGAASSSRPGGRGATGLIPIKVCIAPLVPTAFPPT